MYHDLPRPSIIWRSTLAFCGLICLVYVGWLLQLSRVQPAQAQATVCAGSAITGAAFRDYNFNGVRDALEPGVGGITVTAYDAAGSSTACTTTANGSYGIDPVGAYPVRVEFTLPSDGSLSFLEAGVAGSDSRTTVTFVTGPTANVNVGFSHASDYCGATSTPNLATSCFAFGEQNDNPDGVNKDHTVLYTYSSTSGSTDTTNAAAVRNPPPTAYAAAKQLGSVWGLAWNPRTQTLYAAAFLKRHAGFGPNGPGAIYQITAAGAVSLFHDFGSALGTDPHAQPGQTCLSPGHNNRNDNGNCWLNDPNSFDLIGKMSFGDLDMGDDFKTLYAVNLADKTLMAIPIANPTAATSTALPAPASCPATDLRPFGLGVNDGKVYVGMVCSAESTGVSSNLRAYVYSYANGAFAANPVLDIALNYDRGSSNLKWQPWLNRTTFNPTVTLQRDGKWGQPWLTDIDFDNGDMILGLRDRNADLFGSVAGGPDVNDSRNYTAISRGDILRACANGTGGWALENNGTCGSATTAGAGNGQGPSNGEYYFQDRHPKHEEVSTGAQVQIPGQPDVASIVLNPIDVASEVSDGGVKWYNNRTGVTTRSYLLFDGTGEITLFDKANGLGDVEAMCTAAPLEIGNRVWRDDNGNGVQDPAEAGIDGVVMELYRQGVLVGTTTTANGGQYLFNDSNVNLNGATGLTAGACDANGLSGYEVHIPNASGASQQAALAGLNLTQANQGGATNGELRDSNGTLVNTNAVYAIPCSDLNGPGDNNHTYDFGFTPLVATATPTATPTSTPTSTPTVTPPAPLYSLGNYVWIDENNSGKVDANEVPVPNGVVVELLDGTGNATGKTTTTQQGFYLFSQLNAGDYRVRLAASNFQAGGLLEKYVGSSTGAAQEADPNQNGDQNDNGLDSGTPATVGITTATVTLGGSEPTGETPTANGTPGNDGQGTPDAQSNLTVDIGVIPDVSGQNSLVAIGNLVFYDLNNNGRFEPGAGEHGINGITVQLFSGSATTPSATTTTVNGFYAFDNLTPGLYKVCVAPGNFVSGQQLAGYSSSRGSGSDAVTDQNGDENGQDSETPATTGICSNVVDLELGNAPTGEGQSNYTGQLVDSNVNFTVDFGFVLTPTGLDPSTEPVAASNKIFISMINR